MDETVTISSKYQIVVPKKARKAMQLEPGDQLLCRTEGDEILLRPKPKRYAKHLRGLHKEVWQDVDATQYVKQERKSWE